MMRLDKLQVYVRKNDESIQGYEAFAQILDVDDGEPVASGGVIGYGPTGWSAYHSLRTILESMCVSLDFTEISITDIDTGESVPADLRGFQA